MTNPKRNAPNKALVIKPSSDAKKGIPVMMLNATNKLEPELIPRT